MEGGISTQLHMITSALCIGGLSAVSPPCYACAEFVPQIIKTGIDKLFEVTRQKDQDSLITVLVALQTKGALSAEQLLTGIQKSTNQLEDLRSV